MSDENYFYQCAKSLIFHVENGLKMQFYSKDSDNYEFLPCFRLKFRITVQPHYNAPHYSAVFNITRPCHGSQINYFVIYLL